MKEKEGFVGDLLKASRKNAREYASEKAFNAILLAVATVKQTDNTPEYRAGAYAAMRLIATIMEAKPSDVTAEMQPHRKLPDEVLYADALWLPGFAPLEVK